MIRLAEVQAELRAEGLDGWLLYDFRGLNPIAQRAAGITQDRLLTRRWACLVPADGEPRWLVHAIEAGGMADLAPNTATYISWQAWREGLRAILGDSRRVAMEVSPGCAIPYVARVDAGTVELVRSLGAEVLTSADLVQVTEAVWTPSQLAGHRRAADVLIEVKDLAFDHVRRCHQTGAPVTEFGLQTIVAELLRSRGMDFDHPPIVGVNAHAADPHFEPHRERDTPIVRGDLLLLDLWGKERQPDSVYADITWMAYAGEAVPRRIQQVFEIVREARDAAVAFASERVRAVHPVFGYEVDDAARGVIARAGFGDSFIHRTGHSIGTSTHGNGVNIDNLETQDRRRLLPGVAFSIEPGIYLPGEGFGVRLEIDGYVSEADVEVTTLPLQDEVVLL